MNRLASEHVMFRYGTVMVWSRQGSGCSALSLAVQYTLLSFCSIFRLAIALYYLFSVEFCPECHATHILPLHRVLISSFKTLDRMRIYVNLQ